MLKLLGLEECADTVVGNELIRGISGGQKKRGSRALPLFLSTRLAAFVSRSLCVVAQ